MNPLQQLHPDPARAHTPDGRLYLDGALQQQLREQVFVPSWQWLGRAQELAAAPGSLQPQALLPGLLDEPLLLARDEAGQLRCLSNVCTHRGNLLVTTPCSARRIRCGYHGRSFALDGRMVQMPGFEGVCDFPSAADHLPQLPLGLLWGHAFTSLGAAAGSGTATGFDTLAATLQQRLGFLEIGAWAEDPSRARDYEFEAHWALYVENYLEGLHIPFVHPGLTRQLSMPAYHYELLPGAVLQRAGARGGEAAFEPPPGHPDHGLRIAAYYWWLFPNLMLNVYPWGMSVNLVLPVGATRTRVLFRSYVADPALLGQGAGGALDEVELEDEAVVLTVQQGLRSRLYRGGRYSVVHESGTHHFHRLLAAALGADRTGSG